MTVHYFFKLFDNIKSIHENEVLAKLELEALSRQIFGEVIIKPITNIFEIANNEIFSSFIESECNLKNALTMELPYGKIHGYYITHPKIVDITLLISRLAYTREIFVALELENKKIKKLREKLFPEGIDGNNVEIFEKSSQVIFHFINHQYFLEKSFYISKLSRTKEEIDKNIEKLFTHLIGNNRYRIPSSSTMSVGKRLRDYFAIREEPSLYLTHNMHPYKGKFHPKLARSLINIINPSNDGKIMDNFCGSGTTLVESSLMGLDSIGIEINPISVLMSAVKINALLLDYKHIEKYSNNIKKEVEDFFYVIETSNLKYFENLKENLSVFENLSFPLKEIIKKVEDIQDNLSTKLKKNPILIFYILTIKYIIKKHLKNASIGFSNFFELVLSSSISEIQRKRNLNIKQILLGKIDDFTLRVYLFSKLQERLKISLKKTRIHKKDTCNLSDVIPDNSVNGIVNSPPYSTALDYILNDKNQLLILKPKVSLKDLNGQMIGSPKITIFKKEILRKCEKEIKLILKIKQNKTLDVIQNNKKNDINNFSESPIFLSRTAFEYVNDFFKYKRKDAGIRLYKFYSDMLEVFKEMYRILKPGSSSAIVIGVNRYKVDTEGLDKGNLDKENKYLVKNHIVLGEIAEEIGFKIKRQIKRDLEKTLIGQFRHEYILIIKKPYDNENI